MPKKNQGDRLQHFWIIINGQNYGLIHGECVQRYKSNPTILGRYWHRSPIITLPDVKFTETSKGAATYRLFPIYKDLNFWELLEGDRLNCPLINPLFS